MKNGWDIRRQRWQIIRRKSLAAQNRAYPPDLKIHFSQEVAKINSWNFKSHLYIHCFTSGNFFRISEMVKARILLILFHLTWYDTTWVRTTSAHTLTISENSFKNYQIVKQCIYRWDLKFHEFIFATSWEKCIFMSGGVGAILSRERFAPYYLPSLTSNISAIFHWIHSGFCTHYPSLQNC